jgi:ubiquitin carboxyl-terminal hydrolase 8
MSLDISRYHGQGYTGLANLGNTCFMNACLQVLNHVYELNEHLLVRNIHKRVNKDGATVPEVYLTNEWVELQELMWKTNGVISPNKFLHHLQHLAKVKNKEIFTGWAQNDMPEFLLFFIECLHTTISRSIKMKITGKRQNTVDNTAVECYKMLQVVYKKEYSEIMDIFYGIYVSEITSSDGTQVVSIKPEMYFILDLPIPSHETMLEPTIYDCLDLFTQAEVLEGGNAVFNEKTRSHETVKKRILFWNFPKVLVVTFKRFTAYGRNKRMDLVTFPIESLDLSKYVCGYNPKKYVYDLMGVCNHIGGVMGGHYTAFVQNSQKEWLHFNDMLHQRLDDPNKMITPMAYCLFYRLRG